MPDTLGDRMKGYENNSRHYLTKKVPVIIRIDGQAFHTYTRDCVKPFDKQIMDAMHDTALCVMLGIQGAKCAYIQSDEISILVTDYEQEKTQAWFDYNLQKLTSISASMATYNFGIAVGEQDNPAFFDSRAFNLPKDEVSNYFIWRYQDWVRNSLSMYCHSFFSTKEMHGKGHAQQHEMLHTIGRNWAVDCTEREKNGTLITKQSREYNVQYVNVLKERAIIEGML